MIVPTPVDFSTLAAGTVFTTDNSYYAIKTSTSSVVDLSNGNENATPPSPYLVTPLPGAHLVLG